jgi:hypothetical protein
MSPHHEQGTSMGKEFDSELDAIAGAHQATIDARNRATANTRAAAADFAKAWETCRAGVIEPTLNEIVEKLAAKQMGASTSKAPSGAITLTVVTPGMPDNVRGMQHPHLDIGPGSGVHHVTFAFTAAKGNFPQGSSYSVEQVTRELVEQKALELIRHVYKG